MYNYQQDARYYAHCSNNRTYHCTYGDQQCRLLTTPIVRVFTRCLMAQQQREDWRQCRHRKHHTRICWPTLPAGLTIRSTAQPHNVLQFRRQFRKNSIDLGRNASYAEELGSCLDILHSHLFHNLWRLRLNVHSVHELCRRLQLLQFWLEVLNRSVELRTFARLAPLLHFLHTSKQ